ncbi:alpha/beta hydrolase [Effusibacillus dendaii]|uniref:Alpha/beta hydrolase n=1 Tax=Effusibacillus dendaii TaxID=2743772 RepID=A0A7I8D9E4_9BACL|nr:alpha/beta hydrolase [Effusibacillus dendaii]BCJ86773.1 alpha/beta hydrolase [Effusibacillus dendaii]
MTLDPQAKMFLDQLAASNAPPLSELSPQEGRESISGIKELAGPLEPVAKVEDMAVPVDGGEITVRVYTPSGEGPFPLFVYYHGGGWVIGDLDTVDSPMQAVANRAGCIVASVDYRLAPEYKFPTAVEDCYAATVWVRENAQQFNGDANRIAVGGDSAGGNLAAVVSQLAKQRGGLELAFQVLIYPATDLSFNTQSYRDNGEGYFLTKDSMNWFKNHYLRTESDARNVLASPLLAEDLSDLPPALVITAEYDPLRDEGEAYAARLKEAGVPVELTRYEGMIHGFFWMAGLMDKGKAAIEQVAGSLRSAFGN